MASVGDFFTSDLRIFRNFFFIVRGKSESLDSVYTFAESKQMDSLR